MSASDIQWTLLHCMYVCLSTLDSLYVWDGAKRAMDLGGAKRGMDLVEDSAQGMDLNVGYVELVPRRNQAIHWCAGDGANCWIRGAIRKHEGAAAAAKRVKGLSLHLSPLHASC